jgi:hypothetical protein
MSAWQPDAPRPFFETDPLDEFTLRQVPQFEAYAGPRPCVQVSMRPPMMQMPVQPPPDDRDAMDNAGAAAAAAAGPAGQQQMYSFQHPYGLPRLPPKRRLPREFDGVDLPQGMLLEPRSSSAGDARLAMHVALALGLIGLAYVAVQ